MHRRSRRQEGGRGTGTGTSEQNSGKGARAHREMHARAKEIGRKIEREEEAREKERRSGQDDVDHAEDTACLKWARPANGGYGLCFRSGPPYPLPPPGLLLARSYASCVYAGARKRERESECMKVRNRPRGREQEREGGGREGDGSVSSRAGCCIGQARVARGSWPVAQVVPTTKRGPWPPPGDREKERERLQG